MLLNRIEANHLLQKISILEELKQLKVHRVLIKKHMNMIKIKIDTQQ